MVRVTEPSVEFSTGTSPNSVLPASQERNTSSIEAHGSPSTEAPNCLSRAASENVPAGPR